MHSDYRKSCLVITSSMSSMPRLDRFISGLQKAWKINQEDFDTIRIVLSEALMNAIVHGNKSASSGIVYIDAFRDDDYYTFSIEDDGPGFDFEGLDNPTAEENLNKPNGRGIFIMKHLADGIHFSKNGKCLKLLFNVK